MSRTPATYKTVPSSNHVLPGCSRRAHRLLAVLALRRGFEPRMTALETVSLTIGNRSTFKNGGGAGNRTPVRRSCGSFRDCWATILPISSVCQRSWWPPSDSNREPLRSKRSTSTAWARRPIGVDRGIRTCTGCALNALPLPLG